MITWVSQGSVQWYKEQISNFTEPYEPILSLNDMRFYGGVSSDCSLVDHCTTVLVSCILQQPSRPQPEFCSMQSLDCKHNTNFFWRRLLHVYVMSINILPLITNNNINTVTIDIYLLAQGMGFSTMHKHFNGCCLSQSGSCSYSESAVIMQSSLLTGDAGNVPHCFRYIFHTL